MSSVQTSIEDFLGLQVLWPGPAQKLDKVEHDIVFVHGLHSGPVSDWKDEEDPFWPVDFLGKELNNTRILSFGYDTNNSTLKSASGINETRIFNHGEALCSDLMDNRALLKDREPPTTFIGHGTGGIVVKSALCYSHARETWFGSIVRSTKHVIFLDTPHLGLSHHAWKSISRGTFSENSFGQWKLWSSVLSDLCKLFSEVAVGFNVSSACASLRDDRYPIDNDVAPGDSGLTYLSHERVFHLDGVNHLTISKFRSRSDPNYERISNRIRAGRIRITNNADHISKIWSWLGIHTTIDGQLSSSDSMTWNSADHNTAVQRRHPDTGKWLLRDPAFNTWRSLSHATSVQDKVLWVTGQGGTGKSVLCSLAIQTISKQECSGADAANSIQPATPYIYLRYGKERTACQLAQLLAAQLLEHVIQEQGGVEVEVLSLLRHNASNVDHLQRLIRMLVTQCSAVYFFLDGLNEICLAEAAPSETRSAELVRLTDGLKSTLKFLVEIVRHDDSNVRLWCSSQKKNPGMAWMQEFGATELEMNTALVTQDVQSYLDKVREQTLNRLSDERDAFEVSLRLALEAGPNFRWAYMMAESLKNCPQPKLLVKKVREGLPRDLRESYNARLAELLMLDNKDSEDGNPRLSMAILSLLAYARRPLRLSELQEALSITELTWEKKTEKCCHDLGPESMIRQEDIVDRCTPLVDFVPFRSAPADGLMFISHGSVSEFLRNTSGDLSDESHIRQGMPKASSSSTSNEIRKPVVDNRLIAEACLKYLSQSRYSKPLKKLSAVDFETATPAPTNVRHHRFLQYAAKYWYRHFEDVGCCKSHCVDIKEFITSPQFLTAIQIQSLFVVGHFIHSFDQNRNCGPGAANYGRLMKRNLPEWFRECDEGRKLVTDYESFFCEWSSFLQMGVTDFLNGEIERCLWGALGKDNFLHKFGSRFERCKSYLLAPTQEPATSKGKEPLFETICEGGNRVSVWRLMAIPNSEGNAKSPQRLLALMRDMWYVDGRRPPFLYGPTERIDFDPVSVGWDIYDPSRLRTFPLVPTTGTTLARAPPVADCRHGLNLRIGGVEFYRENEPGGPWMPKTMPQGFLNARTDSPRIYWESVLVHGPYKVWARRVMVGLRPTSEFSGHKTRSGMTQQGDRRRRIVKHETPDSSTTESDGDFAEDIVSSAYEYWTFGSSASEAPESEEQNEEWSGNESEEHDDTVRDKNSSFLASLDKSPGGGASSSKGALSPKSDSSSCEASDDEQSSSASSASSTGNGTATTDLDSGDEADSEGGSHDQSDPSDQSDQSDQSEYVSYQPGIARRRLRLYCDKCKERITNPRLGTSNVFYQCGICNDSNSYDVCGDCFSGGKWCESNAHQLRKMVARKGRLVTLEILSRDDARTGISLAVSVLDSNNSTRGTSDLEDPVAKIAFRYTTRLRNQTDCLLHDSPPVMHPTLPLLVYPLEGTKLLFANLRENSYMTYNVPYDETEKSHQMQGDKPQPLASISIDMRFSLCGRYLHVARVTAAKSRQIEPNSKVLSNNSRLFAQLVTVRLSQRNPCSGVPRILTTRQGIELGTWQSTAVLTLPYRFTWADSYLYVSMVSPTLMLCVFRIPLPVSGDLVDDAQMVRETTISEHGTEKREDIMALGETFPLPRSARTRPIHFFPGNSASGSCDRVILGSSPNSCAGTEQAQPPAVVYLRSASNDGMVKWVSAKEAVISTIKDPHSGSVRMRKNDQLLEEFDADSDCDLIMPLLDFQR